MSVPSSPSSASRGPGYYTTTTAQDALSPIVDPAAPTFETYDRDKLEYRDGKLYVGDVEVTPSARIRSTSQGLGDEGPQETIRPLWSYSTLGDILSRPSDISEDSGYVPLQQRTDRAAQQAAYDQYSALANPYTYTPEQRFNEFASQYRPVLYGAYAHGPTLSFNDDSGLGAGGPWVSRWDGSAINLGGGNGGRGEMSIQRTDQYVRPMLARMFPGVDQDDLDRAAYHALSKRSAAQGGDTWHYGMNPNDILRGIGAELGGVPSDWEERLTASDLEMSRLGQNWVSQAHANDDADDFGLGDFASIALPMAMMFIPGMQGLAGTIGQALGAEGLAATAIGNGIINGGLNLLQTGDLGSALKSGALSGLGSYAGGAVGGLDALKGVDPTIVKALSGGVSGLIRSGGNLQSAGYGALTGGLSQFASGALPTGYQNLAPVVGALGSSALTGRNMTTQQLLQTLAMAANDTSARPRQALVK